MEHIKIGRLEECFLGYSPGATVYAHFSESGQNMFCILCDPNDEFFGSSVSTSKPKILIERTLNSEISVSKFFTLYKLLRTTEAKIPTSFELFDQKE